MSTDQSYFTEDEKDEIIARLRRDRPVARVAVFPIPSRVAPPPAAADQARARPVTRLVPREDEALVGLA